MKCSRCSTTGNRNFYNGQEKRKSGLCKVCYARYLKEHRQFLKLRAIEYRGGKCEECGYDKCRAALAFHHVDNKDMEINKLIRASAAWDSIVIELDKCKLLCNRCHMEKHHLVNEIIEFEFEFEFEHSTITGRKTKRSGLKERDCPVCKNAFRPRYERQKYCSRPCVKKAARKVKDRPTPEELKRLKKEMSFVAIGKVYGVSDNTIRKWINL